MDGIIRKAGIHVIFKSILMILITILMFFGKIGVTDAAVITVGSQPSTGTAWGNNSSADRTYVNVTAGTGANDTGTLDNIEIYITGCGAGDNFYIYTISTSFVYNDVLTLACDDFTVPGYNQLTAGVTPGFPAGGLAVTQNDWIGFYGVTLTVDRDATGTGTYSYSNTNPTTPAPGGSHVEQNTNTRVMGIYGTGNTPLAGDTLTASGSFNMLTGDPDEGATGFAMQRFQVSCSNDDDGSCWLSSLTIQDDGNASSLSAHVYISSTSNDSALPGGATLLGSTSGWTGASTAVTLSGAAREVTNAASPQYIYIIYDIPAGQGGNTIQSNVTALSVDSPDGVSGGNVGANTQRNVISCETATVNVVDPGGPITGSTTINVTLGGTGGSNPEWSTDQVTWYASGTQYTPPSCSSGSVTFYGRATGSCSTVTDPTPVNQTYDTLETKTVTLSVASPITTATAITAGGTASNLEVRWDEGGGWSGWMPNGSTYTPSCGSGTVNFEAQGTGDCSTVTASDTGNSYSYADPDPSIITIPASQTFNGDPYNVSSSYTITQGDVGSIQFKVTTGSGGGSSVNELEYFDSANTMCDWSFWTASGSTACGAGDPAQGELGTHNDGTTDNGSTHTPSASTGPTSLHSGTHGSSGGFIFREESGASPYPWADRTFTRNAQFDADANELHISFAYSVNGASAGTLLLEVDDGDGGGWVTEWSQVGDDGNGGAWTAVDLNLFAGGGASTEVYDNGLVDMRFRWTGGTAYDGDMALDTIRVYGPARSVETVCTDWTSNASIPASGTPCDPYVETTDNYNLYVRGTDPDCGDPVTASPDPQQFTWNSCSNADTLSLVVADNLTVPTAITATYTGTPTNIEVRWDDGSGWSTWQPNGSTFTPADVCTAGTVNFEARGDDSNCGQYALSASDYGNTYQIMDDVATLTISDPVSSSTVSGGYTVQVQVGGETARATMGSMSLTIGNSGQGCNESTPNNMAWNGTSSRWEYIWDTSTCGDPTPDTGITIDASGVDPDCAGTINASQVTNITIDNTGPTYTIDSCADCHNMPPADSTGGRGTPTKSVVGSHGVAEHLAAACTNCHIDNGTPASAYPQGLAHREGLIEMIVNLHGQTGAYYDKDGSGTQTGADLSFAQSDTPALGSCKSTFCHGTSSPTWGSDLSGTAQCKRCHGDAVNPNNAPPVDTAGNTGSVSSNVNNDEQIGAHQVHLQSLNDYSNDIPCSECHAVPSSPGDAGHIDDALPADMTWGDLATHNSGVYAGGQDLTPSYVGGVCSNYCHGGNTFPADGAPSTQTDPDWNTSLLNGNGGSDCGMCHGNPPNDGNHGSVSSNVCSGCHPHVNDSATSAPFFNNLPLHLNGVLDGGGECITCHDTGGIGTTGPNNRRAVVPEFALAWSHKKDAGGTVTNEDCVVCHMEGVAGTTSPSGVHADGFIDLRDPDTGVTIKTVTFSGGTGSDPGSYSSTGSDQTFAEFSRDLNSSTIEAAVAAMQINHCLKCHDSDGALSTDARVTGGTAMRPFNTTPNHTPGNNVLDVNSHFATTNSSYHPVRGKQNNTYTDNDKMKAPWNTINKTEGGALTQWGDLISCWDCHAPSGATGVQTATVTAHGGSVTLRGTSYVTGTPSSGNAVTLCVICHNGYDTQTTATHGLSGVSAAGDLDRNEKIPYMRWGCFKCHGSADAPVRPTRSADVHGFDGSWGGGTAQVSFIRNTDALSEHLPASIGGTNYGGECTGMNGVGCGGSNRNEVYSPGGVY